MMELSLGGGKEESLAPVGVAFSSTASAGDRIFSIRVVVGSESVLEEVSDR